MKKSITRLAIGTMGLGLLMSAGCASMPFSTNSTAAGKVAPATPPTEKKPEVTINIMQGDKATAPAVTTATETVTTPAADAAPVVAAVAEPVAEPTATTPDLQPVASPAPTMAKTVPSVYRYTPDSSNSLGTEKQLSEFCREIAGKVYYELKQDGDKHLTARVAVVDAVPLADLKRETEFGRLISEYMLTDLADRGLKVTELRMGKEINILPQTGEFILSRNIGELATDSPMLDYVLVSTFTNTRKTLILQGRLVGLKSGLVETSWRYTLPLNRELLGLFHTREQPFTIAVNGMNH